MVSFPAPVGSLLSEVEGELHVASPSQSLWLSVSSLKTDRGWVVQVKSPVSEMVAGCRGVDSSCSEHRKEATGIELL